MDHARMPSGGFRYGRTRTREIQLEELTLDFFLDQYDKNEFGYLQGGFRSNGDRCPAAAVTDGFGEKYGGGSSTRSPSPRTPIWSGSLMGRMEIPTIPNSLMTAPTLNGSRSITPWRTIWGTGYGRPWRPGG